MQTNSPKRTPRAHPKTYSTCLLYNTKEAQEKLTGLSLASCNPVIELIDQKPKVTEENYDVDQSTEPAVPELPQLSVSDKMSCIFCDAKFEHRVEQKRHYRSDWHRYNLKQRIKGRAKVTEELFEEISGEISSLSGSDSDLESDSDISSRKKVNKQRLAPEMSSQLRSSAQSSTDSESETGNQAMDRSRRLPKLYFRNGAGELLSIYRCVICHKKEQASRPEELITMVTDVLGKMNWAVFMVGGGHFAAAIYNKDQLVTHKTFHRYVVRAKRGTAQSSRDGQGNAPKSAGASLRRYNEAALTQDIQDLITSWSQQIKTCDRIFLRAPSFNRKIFFSGKTTAFNKDDSRIRLIPFQTRRPTFNEVRRVYEMLASIECYGDESELRDLIPISPPQVFDRQSGQLTVRDETQLSPRQRKLMNRKLKSSPLVTGQKQASADADQTDDIASTENLEKEVVKALPGHLLEEDYSGTSTGSDTELLETMETMDLLDHKEFYATKKPKRRKKSSKQRRQTEPESNVMDEEKYHLKNSLYTACKVGDTATLKNLLAIFTGRVSEVVNKATADDAKLNDKLAISEVSKPNNTVYQETEEDHSDSSKKQMKDGVNSEQESVNIVQESVKSGQSINSVQESVNSVQESVNSIQESVKSVLESVNSSNVNEFFVKDCDTDINESSISSEITDDRNAQKESEYLKSGILQCEKSSHLESDSSNVKQGISSENAGKVKECKQFINVDDETKNLIDLRAGNEGKVNTNNVVEDTDTFRKDGLTSDLTAPNTLPISLEPVRTVQEPVPVQDMSPVVTLSMLNESFGDNSTTLLHVAAKEGHKAVVLMLMEAGADPTLKEKSGHTPYMVSKDKPTRNEFRKFMGRWPDKHDYDKAQIPSPLTDEMQAEQKKKEAEKKKAQKKVKQEKQKVKREEEAKKAAEEKEKQRFLNLSDREKRALAAERRLVSQATSAGTANPVLVRCFQCGEDMTGKVPFEYNANKFCSSKCLQQHRKSMSKS